MTTSSESAIPFPACAPSGHTQHYAPDYLGISTRPQEALHPSRTAYLVRCLSDNNIHVTERHYPPQIFVPLHAHQHHYVIIGIKGEFESKFGKSSKRYKPWSVTLQPAGVSHTSTYSNEGSHVLYVRISPALFSLCEQHLKVDEVGVSIETPEASGIAQQIYREFRDSDEFTLLMLESLLLQLVTSYGRNCRTRSRTPKWLHRAEDLICSHFRNSLTLATLSEQIGVHPVHLAREFKRWRGCTVGERIRQERVRYATDQLSKTRRTLADIALSAGFADQPHFTATFKRAIGITPAKYRRSMVPG